MLGVNPRVFPPPYLGGYIFRTRSQAVDVAAKERKERKERQFRLLFGAVSPYLCGEMLALGLKPISVFYAFFAFLCGY